MAKIRLGFYMYTPEIGGAERHLRDLLWSLDRERYTITLFSEPWLEFEQFLGLKDCPEIRHLPIRIHEIDRPLRNLTGNRAARYFTIARLQLVRYFWTAPDYRRLQAAFASTPLDILHIDNGGYPGAWTARWASIAAKSVGIRACVMTIASTPIGPQLPAWLDRQLDRRVIRAVDTFATVSNEVARALQAKHHVPADKIATLYYGIQPPRADLTPMECATVRERWGLLLDAPVIGMAARLDPIKGHCYLLEALTQLPKNITALIIGGGPYLEVVQQRARDLGLGVKFTGALPHAQAQQAMAACDIITLPSEIEGLPYVISEAMSLKKPVVASAVGGIPEQIVDGETGVLVPPRDPVALAAALKRLLDQPALARVMGDAAYQRYLAHFSLSKMIREHDMLYHALCAREISRRSFSA